MNNPILNEEEYESSTESYDDKLDRWREDWKHEIDDDLDNGR